MDTLVLRLVTSQHAFTILKTGLVQGMPTCQRTPESGRCHLEWAGWLLPQQVVPGG